jgi:hypothetical protein
MRAQYDEEYNDNDDDSRDLRVAVSDVLLYLASAYVIWRVANRKTIVFTIELFTGISSAFAAIL